MGSKRKKYAEAFKKKLVTLAREGRTPTELSRQFEPSAQAIRNWIDEAERAEQQKQPALSGHEREELQRLRRENERLREEREILKKAAAWFAQETKAAPNGSSGS